MSTSPSLNGVKSFPWSFISLSKSEGFKGAVHDFHTDNGVVWVCFNLHECFVVEDEQGLFGKQDLIDGIIKADNVDIFETGLIYGLNLLAWEDNGFVSFDDEYLDKLGLDDYAVKKEIEKCLLLLASIDQTKEIPLG